MTETLKPGTRCECRDRTHVYDNARPYARHNAGTCPNLAVRMVTVWEIGCVQMPGESEPGDQVHGVAMCEPCAAYHEKASARS